MGKVVLVLDNMPNSCAECPMFCNHYSDMCCRVMNNRTINYPYPENSRQDWCPLQWLPTHKFIWHDDERDDWERGYNSCLDEILGINDVCY